MSLHMRDTIQTNQGDLFLGVRTDTVLESSYENMSAHKNISIQNSKLVVSCRYLYESPDEGDS